MVYSPGLRLQFEPQVLEDILKAQLCGERANLGISGFLLVAGSLPQLATRAL